MTEERHALEQTMRRAGIFDGRTVHATQYKNEQGKIGWFIMTWPFEGDPVDDYWLEGENFYRIVGLSIWPPSSQIETGRIVSDMDIAVRKVVMDAIAKWEAEIA
jgi:hypothetical protein